jgi:hypothetical protein
VNAHNIDGNLQARLEKLTHATLTERDSMTTATYTHAENAAFLHGVADTLERIGDPVQSVERLHDLAAREAEQDPAYVAYVNAKVRAALASPDNKLLTEAEIDAQIETW